MVKVYMTVLILMAGIACQSNNKPEKRRIRIENLAKELRNAYTNDNCKKAKPILDKLIELDSLNGEWYYSRGYCNRRLLNFGASTKDYKNAVRLEYHISDAYYNLGVNSFLHNDSLALSYFQQSLRYDSTNEDAKQGIKDALKKIERARDPETDIEKAFKKEMEKFNAKKTI